MNNVKIKHQLILDVLDDGTWSIDVRDNGITIGHIMLSKTGVAWKDPHAQLLTINEVAWKKFKDQLSK